MGGPAGANEHRYAIVVGISEYADDAIPDLAYAAEDARAFYDFLRSPAAGYDGFREENIRLLINEGATARALRSAFASFLDRTEPSPRKVLYVFLVAHGLPSPVRPSDVYLLAHDTRLDDMAGTGVDLDFIRDAVVERDTYLTAVFADVTRSGSVGNARSRLEPNRAGARLRPVDERVAGADRGAAPPDGGGGFVAFTASEGGQISQEGEQWGGGHGVFTHYLMQGLAGAADLDGDRVVSLGEALEYTRDRVRRETGNAQVPTISRTSYDLSWPMAAVTEPRE